jgi:Domain of unknown function (DUF4384)
MSGNDAMRWPVRFAAASTLAGLLSATVTPLAQAREPGQQSRQEPRQESRQEPQQAQTQDRHSPAHQLPAQVLSQLQAQAQNTAPPSPQPERSVTILPDGPDATVAPPPISADQLAALNAVKADNAAGVSLDLIPSGEVIAGSKLGFRITAQKAGYLILVNVDASGRLVQIFPNTPSLGEDTEVPNLIKPGKPLTIPQLGTPYAAFEFVAQPPSGLAMLVAMLSDRPVQVVDLPDAPPPAFAPADTLKYVRDKTRTLIVPDEDGRDWKRPNWSFDGKFYLIK